MIVENTGYLKIAEVIQLASDGKKFGIYRTPKDTLILFNSTVLSNRIDLCRPKLDRLPWKMVEGRKIMNSCTLVFDSTKDDISTFDFTNANMGSQLMSYKDMWFTPGF